ncbi:MAG: ExbD/TolR family protein, partial [Flavobacterium sp.]
EDKIKVDENRTMTILIGADNKVKWYLGMPSAPLEGPTESAYGQNGIRKVIMEYTKKALAYSQNPEDGLIVIIKASEKANYRNLVDILDEMAITGTKTYAIVDISDKELEFLGEK